ncbi:M20/M25/M40 family metallo-hydrolase [Micromonospora sp. BRA006-A]|nr:M20/M25/M40 family metallo-hydrolase [Micromonospora sp. BRA006-A]
MPKPDTAAALAAVDAHFDEFVEELQQLCRIRSRRQEPEQMEATAEFIAGSVRRWGGEAEIIPWEQSYPYVLAEVPGEGDKALLHFTHYDVEVEPAGDDADWISPPYAAEIHDGRLYARGVADDKGVVMSRIHAAAAWKLAGLTPPVTNRSSSRARSGCTARAWARSCRRTPTGSPATPRCGRTPGSTARTGCCSSSPRRACSTCASPRRPCHAT